ncbi:hypothetical protein LCGC14_0443460 [marine sediment metagenome]|uniref:Uncharacterized protein n=1 Tax=marine sediment metagenome TaxID=412755 RepID=A0A0F9SJN4_9ZZZZ
MMGREDGSTEAFKIAEASFVEAADEIYDLRIKTIELRQTIETAENWVRERERDVGAEVQTAPDEGVHNAETRMARTVEILGRDEIYLGHREAAKEAREGVARADAELERWRDRRSVARRWMDLLVALARPDDQIEVARSDSHA